MNREVEVLVKHKGRILYQTFDGYERFMVRIGLLPGVKMQAAQAELLATPGMEDVSHVDIGRLLAVGVMDAANAGPDKMIV